jgi:hypothetical protein
MKNGWVLVVLGGMLSGCYADHVGDLDVRETDTVTEENTGESSGGSGHVAETSSGGAHVVGGAGGLIVTVSTGGMGLGGEPSSDSSGGADSTGGSDSSGGQSHGSGGAADASSGGAESVPVDSIYDMPLPATIKDQGTCWQDSFPNPVCEDIPEFSPQLIEWDCSETRATLLIPPGVCLRVTGRFQLGVADDQCLISDPTVGCNVDQPEQKTSIMTNSTDEIMIRYIHRRRDCDLGWMATWHDGECP